MYSESVAISTFFICYRQSKQLSAGAWFDFDIANIATSPLYWYVVGNLDGVCTARWQDSGTSTTIDCILPQNVKEP